MVNPVVHLELRTANLSCACAFYTRLFGWSADAFRTGSGAYLTLQLGQGIQGGVLEWDREPAAWLPYVEVADIAECVERARALGAEITLEPHEGPAGWRSELAMPAGAEIALWQPKL